MKRIYLLLIILLLSVIPAHGQAKGVDPHYFETGLWVCNGGGDAASLDDDIANVGNNVTLTRVALNELANYNKCHRIEADNIKPISWATRTSTGCSLLVGWGDGKATAWVGIRSWLGYMRWHVVRKPEKKMDRVQ